MSMSWDAQVEQINGRAEVVALLITCPEGLTAEALRAIRLHVIRNGAELDGERVVGQR